MKRRYEAEEVCGKYRTALRAAWRWQLNPPAGEGCDCGTCTERRRAIALVKAALTPSDSKEEAAAQPLSTAPQSAPSHYPYGDMDPEILHYQSGLSNHSQWGHYRWSK